MRYGECLLGEAVESFLIYSENGGVASEQDLEESLKSFLKSLDLANQLLERHEIPEAECNQIISDCYLNIASRLEAKKDFTQALVYFSRCGEFAEKCQDCERKVNYLNAVGFMYISMKDYEKAEEQLLKALKIANENGYHDGAIDALYNLGVFYKVKGNFLEAKRVFTLAFDRLKIQGNREGLLESTTEYLESTNECIKLRKKLPELMDEVSKREAENDTVRLFRLYGKVSEAFEVLGEMEKAVAYKECQSNLMSLMQLDEADQIEVYNSLSFLYETLEKYFEAATCIRKIISLQEDSAGVYEKAHSLYRLSICLRKSLYDFESIEPLLLQSIKLARESGDLDLQIKVLSEQLLLYETRGNLTKSAGIMEECKSLIQVQRALEEEMDTDNDEDDISYFKERKPSESFKKFVGGFQMKARNLKGKGLHIKSRKRRKEEDESKKTVKDSVQEGKKKERVAKEWIEESKKKEKIAIDWIEDCESAIEDVREMKGVMKRGKRLENLFEEKRENQMEAQSSVVNRRKSLEMLFEEQIENQPFTCDTKVNHSTPLFKIPSSKSPMSWYVELCKKTQRKVNEMLLHVLQSSHKSIEITLPLHQDDLIPFFQTLHMLEDLEELRMPNLHLDLPLLEIDSSCTRFKILDFSASCISRKSSKNFWSFIHRQTQLKTLDVSYTPFIELDVELLLMKCGALESLNLAGCLPIHSDKIKVSLPRTLKARQINVSDNFFDEQVLVSFFDLFIGNQNLYSLDVSFMDLSFVSLVNLRYCTARKLIASNCLLGIGMEAAICEAIKYMPFLEEVDISGNLFPMDQIVSAVEYNCAIKSLTISKPMYHMDLSVRCRSVINIIEL